MHIHSIALALAFITSTNATLQCLVDGGLCRSGIVSDKSNTHRRGNLQGARCHRRHHLFYAGTNFFCPVAGIFPIIHRVKHGKIFAVDTRNMRIRTSMLANQCRQLTQQLIRAIQTDSTLVHFKVINTNQ